MEHIIRFSGVPYFLNGQQYLVASLSLRQVKENDELLSKVHEVNLGDKEGVKRLMDLYTPIIGMAFRRNYPEVTDEGLTDWMDLGNFADLISIVLGTSGYRRVDPLGEVKPAA